MNLRQTKLGKGLYRLCKRHKAVAATEFALVAPVLVSMFLGTVDLGRALWASHKVLGASQTVADLLTRKEMINDNDIADALDAAALIMQPLPINEVGYDIVGIRYDLSDTPQVGWRETVRMDANANLPGAAIGLGIENEGVLGVSLSYTYTPAFFGFLLGEIELVETAILRGRKSPYVAKES